MDMYGAWIETLRQRQTDRQTDRLIGASAVTRDTGRDIIKN